MSLILAYLSFSTILLAAVPKITLNLENATLKQAMDEISMLTDLKVAYSQEFVNHQAPVTLKANNLDLDKALRQMLKNTDIGYKITDKEILLFNLKTILPKEAPAPRVRTVEGEVLEKSTGAPMIGVSISTEDNKTGTITDLDGKFTIQVPENEALHFRYIGYQNKKLYPPASGMMNVLMDDDAALLNEVVVVGFGTQKKVNLTGAVGIIDSKEINGRPVSSSVQALQGLDPSLNISINSGTANSSYSIDIRGAASINDGSPLVLVDGVEMDLSRVNFNDIESVSILKDASSAAVYGAKASAGVVLVTTKSGQAGKATITYNGRYGIAKNTTSTDYISNGYDWTYVTDKFFNSRYGYGYTQYGEQDYAELWMRRNDKTENPSRPWAVAQSNGNYKYYANTDWYDYIFRETRPQTEHNIILRGGSDNVNYYISGRYYHTEGMMKQQNDPYDSYNIRSRINIKLRPWLRFSTNINYFNDKSWWPGMKSPQTTFRNVTFGGAAYVPPTNPDGSIVHLQTYTNQSAPVLNGMNLLLTYGKTSNSSKTNEIMIKNNLEIDIVKDLTANVSYAYKYYNTLDAYRYTNAPYSQKEGVIEWLNTSYCRDEYNEVHYHAYTNLIDGYLEYRKTFDKHSIKATAGFQYEKFNNKKLTAVQRDLLSEDLSDFNLATGEITTLTGGVKAYQTLGLFGRINYDYQGKYLFEASGRYDGSSRFRKKDRWGFFPSLSLGWRMSEELFWNDLQSIWSNNKVRFSVGSLGNQQVGYYDYIDVIETNKSSSSYTLDGLNQLSYARESDPTSYDLTWETVTTYNLGLDMGFLNNRLNLSGDVYLRKTKDMLTKGMTLPSVYGAEFPKMNAADMETKGWELALSWKDSFTLAGKPFTYNLRATIGDYTSKITKFANETKLLTDLYEGMTLGEIWGFETNGLFATDEEARNYPVDQTLLLGYINGSVVDKGLLAGDIRFVDRDGDDILSIGANTANDPGDRKVIGNSLPRYSYSFGGGFQWMGVDVSVLFQGVGRQHWYPSNEANLFWGPFCRPHNTFLSRQFIDQLWSEDNPDSYFPRPRGYEAYGNYHTLSTPNDRYIQNIAYLRVKNLSIGYTLPVLKNTFQNIRVYVTGENLFYWSPMKKHNKYIDPEASKSNTSYTDGTGEVYNFSKTFSVGIDITF